MRQDYERLFRNLSQIEPSQELLGSVLARINIEKVRIARTKLLFAGIIAMASFVALIPIFQYTFQEFYKSGFYQYISLIFSDGGVIFTSWKEFLLVIAESVPVIEIVVLLSVTLAFLESIKLAIKNIKVGFLKVKLS